LTGPGEVPHSEISRALARLGEDARSVEVIAALEYEGESFEAQMRRRMYTRSRVNRHAYLILARAGGAKVRLHLEATGDLPCRVGPPRRSIGAIVRVRDRESRQRRRIGHRGGRK
jgi:hypothetical protein